MSPQPAQGNGPWGAAIRYWLHKKGLSQADLVRDTALGKNTVSYAVRGLDTTTATLRVIAQTLKEPLELVLVSPEWKDRQEHQERVIASAVSRALREMNMHAPSGDRPTDAAVFEATRRDADHRKAEAEKPTATRSSKHRKPLTHK